MTTATVPDELVTQIATEICRNNAQLSSECVQRAVAEAIDALISCLGSGDVMGCMVAKLPSIAINFIRCQLGWSSMSQAMADSKLKSCLRAHKTKAMAVVAKIYDNAANPALETPAQIILGALPELVGWLTDFIPCLVGAGGGDDWVPSPPDSPTEPSDRFPPGKRC